MGGDWTKPENFVGNGPFIPAERVPNDHIRLARNPLFHDASSVKLDAVMYYPTEDRSTAIKRFQAGELDSNDDLPIEQLADLRAAFGDQVRVTTYLGVYYSTSNWTRSRGISARLRRAISMAIDREFIAGEVWGGATFPAYGSCLPALLATSPMLPTMQPFRKSIARRRRHEL